jgi:hypothetical protein
MNMKTVIIILCVSLFSWIGWWLGARFGLMAAYLLSFIGSLIGVYGGVRILCLPGKEPVFTIPDATTITITGTGAIPIIPAPIRQGNGAHPNCPDKGRCC